MYGATNEEETVKEEDNVNIHKTIIKEETINEEETVNVLKTINEEETT